jgi:DNA helicase IV
MSRRAEIAREQAVVTGLYARLDAIREQTRTRLVEVRRRGASGTPQARSERDAFASMYEDRLAALEAVEPGLCFGRIDLTGGEQLHIGRIGLTDDRHDTMLVDWRAPAASAFYRATPAEPHGVVRRRHLRTHAREVVDVEDDVFDVDELTDADRETLGGGGALLAALTAVRTGRMRDIVATIQAEQDWIIRADPTGVLVVQGGPGTGKTAVALHRAAYLLYSNRDRLARTGVLVVGPGPAFLRYIEQVLPSLGETGVVLSTVAGLVSGVDFSGEDPPDAAALKADLRMADLVDAAVAALQAVPDDPLTVRFDEHELVLTPNDIAAARNRARRSRRRHNRARYAFARQLLRVLVGQLAEIDPELARERWVVRTLMADDDFREVVDACWPRISAPDLVRDLLSRERLDAVGSGLFSADERRALARSADAPWTPADAPLIDEAWARLGDPEEVLREAAARRAARAEREYATQVVAASGLRGQVDAGALAERFSANGPGRLSVIERAASDPDWEFGHLIVDEAQELSPMAWRMLLRRVPTRSMTVVGDVAQGSAAWATRSWSATLSEVAPDRWRVAELTVNYRTPAEVMEVAADVLLAVDPTAQAPTSVRTAGVAPGVHPVEFGGDLEARTSAVATEVAAAVPDGKIAVITPTRHYEGIVAAIMASFPGRAGTGAAGLDATVAILTAGQAKGLEFDAVVLVDPREWVDGADGGLRDLYVALTRATQRLDVVHVGELPAVLARLGEELAEAG